jgi:hypothetical protein
VAAFKGFYGFYRQYVRSGHYGEVWDFFGHRKHVGHLTAVLVRPPRRGRIGIVSERGRRRSREQATTTTTAAGEPLAGPAFFVEDMECRQADIGNFLLAERDLTAHSKARGRPFPEISRNSPAEAPVSFE